VNKKQRGDCHAVFSSKKRLAAFWKKKALRSARDLAALRRQIACSLRAACFF